MKLSFSELTTPRQGAVALGVTAGRKLTKMGSELDRASGGVVTRAMEASRFTGARDKP